MQMMTAEDVGKYLKISKGKAYKVIKDLNEELDKKGFYTITGRIAKEYIEERFLKNGDVKK